MAVTISTWNLHGSAWPDIDAIVERLSTMTPDVAALQEIQHRQASAIARALGWTTAYWSFKHFPILRAPEGLAVLSPYRLENARTVVLTRWTPPWSHRRRIAQVVTLRLADRVVRLANVHLASDATDDRVAQAQRLLATLRPDTIVAGDLNARPDSEVLRLFSTAGLRDAWGTLHPDATEADGATHWRPGDPDRRPTRRLDYVLVPEHHQIVTALVPTAADSDLTAYRRLSDHLPVASQHD